MFRHRMSLWCAACVVGFSLLALLPAQQAQKSRKFAFLVGVNRYEHPKLNTLNFAVNDVTALAALLKIQGYEVILLSDSEGKTDKSKVPTKTNIETQLAKLLKRCRGGDLVVLAFAGHGLQFDDDKEAYFCPNDGKPFPTQKQTLLSLGKVYQDLDESYAGVKLLLVDACRDDPTASRKARGVTAEVSPKLRRGMAALFSCSAGEVSFEEAKLKHGVFFHYVLEGLRGKAKNSDGEVTPQTLAGYVQRRVAVYARDTIKGGAKQTPELVLKLRGLPPVLAGPMAGKTFTNTLGMQFVRVAKGTFWMGERKPPNYETKNAVKQVEIKEDFYMGVHEVTQGQWQAVMGNNPSWFSRTGVGKDSVKAIPTPS